MKFKKDRIVNGYILIYKPNCPSSYKEGNHKGYVYEHIYVATKELGRTLEPGEVVHHLDLNKRNNDITNLLVLTNSQHMKLHSWLRRYDFIIKPGSEERRCLHCNKIIRVTLKYCSKTCELLTIRSKRPDKEELESDLVNLPSIEAIGRKYNVTGNGVKKWLINYNLPTNIQPSVTH